VGLHSADRVLLLERAGLRAVINFRNAPVRQPSVDGYEIAITTAGVSTDGEGLNVPPGGVAIVVAG
jgi:hypothetical protein